MKKRLSMMAVALCAVMMVGSLSVTAYARGGDEYIEPTEQWEGLDPVEETPAPTVEPGEGFTEDGNLVTRDLLYTDATTITKRMVGELIDHIDVYPAVKEDGVTNQRVVIFYNCIGAFEVPDRRKIPEADIIMETRKGVALSYAPAQIAI